jgi:endo-1,4-beta-mannosidase
MPGGKTLLTVFGVYVPYCNGHNDQIQLYSETLDILQSAIDSIGPSPLVSVGDVNAPSPRHVQLSRFWYQQHPYNKHSYILHDCLTSNYLKAVDFNFDQDVSYTYFNATSQSYIDHVFSSSCAH